MAVSGSNDVCGRCFQIQFTGTSHNGGSAGQAALNGKTMIGAFTNACPAQWGTSDLGAQYGGFLTGCNGDANCARPDNPNLVYRRVSCPAALAQKSGLRDPG